jgi:hypothetical protein
MYVLNRSIVPAFYKLHISPLIKIENISYFYIIFKKVFTVKIAKAFEVKPQTHTT